MNEYDILRNVCKKAGFPLSDEQQVLIAGALTVILDEHHKASMKAAEAGIDKAIELEREACAKICDKDAEEFKGMEMWADNFAREIAAAIRARGQI